MDKLETLDELFAADISTARSSFCACAGIFGSN